jgi:hypothetical protein
MKIGPFRSLPADPIVHHLPLPTWSRHGCNGARGSLGSRATDATDFPVRGCRLDTAQRILPHEAARTTKLDAGREGKAILDRVEGIAIDPQRDPDRSRMIGAISRPIEP